MLRGFFVFLFGGLLLIAIGFGVYIAYQTQTLPEFLRHHGPYPIDRTLKPTEQTKYAAAAAEQEYLTKIKTSLQTHDREYVQNVLNNVLDECQYTDSDKQLRLYVAYGYQEIGLPKKAVEIYETLLLEKNRQLDLYDPATFRQNVPTASRYTVWLHEEVTNRLVSFNLL